MYSEYHLYRKHTVILLGILAGMASARCLPAQVGLGLAPMRLEMRLNAGTQSTGALNLTNNSAARVRVRAEKLDFFFDATETPQFERILPQESAYSCREWLSLNPMEIDLEPGGQVLVRYTLRVPQDVPSRSYHCAAGFTTTPTADQMSQTGLKTAVCIVSAFYAVVGNPLLEADFKDIRLEYVSNARQPGWRGVVVMENFSFMHFRPVGNLDVLDSEGRVVDSASLNSIAVLPKREQRLLVPLKRPLVAGNYTLRARVYVGGPKIQEGVANVVVPAATP